MKVLNPTLISEVKHNVNGNIYKIGPGESTEVRHEDVDNLLELLPFLIAVDEEGNHFRWGEVEETKQNGRIPAVLADELKKYESDNLLLFCDELVESKDPATGIKRKIRCNFSTLSKQALTQHGIVEHLKGQMKNDSRSRPSTKDDEVPLSQDLEAPKRRGRPPKSENSPE